MWTPLFISILTIAQVAVEDTPKRPRVDLEAVFARAAKEPDIEDAGLVLSELLSDESTLRAAFLTPVALDERSVHILFGADWGPRANLTWKDRVQWHRILVETISTKPALIRSVLRADRYETYDRRRHPQGAATINLFPFFSFAKYADDLLESSLEGMRTEMAHPTEAIMSPYNNMRAKGSPPLVLVTADEVEVNLLGTWQMLCGIANRLDLIDKATTKNWRDRFPELDAWFQKNRPYVLWDNAQSCVRIDEEGKKSGSPTSRKDRRIPELKPPWLAGTR